MLGHSHAYSVSSGTRVRTHSPKRVHTRISACKSPAARTCRTVVICWQCRWPCRLTVSAKPPCVETSLLHLHVDRPLRQTTKTNCLLHYRGGIKSCQHLPPPSRSLPAGQATPTASSLATKARHFVRLNDSDDEIALQTHAHNGRFRSCLSKQAEKFHMLSTTVELDWAGSGEKCWNFDTFLV